MQSSWCGVPNEVLPEVDKVSQLIDFLNDYPVTLEIR